MTVPRFWTMADQEGGKADSGLDEIKKMIAALTQVVNEQVKEQMSAQTQAVNEQLSGQVREIREALADGLQAAADVARRVAEEQCDGLRVKVETQLQEVKEETVVRVDEL